LKFIVTLDIAGNARESLVAIDRAAIDHLV